MHLSGMVIADNMAITSVIEYKLNLLACAAVPRHLSGCVIVVILAKFVLQVPVQKIRCDVYQTLLSAIILLISVIPRTIKVC